MTPQERAEHAARTHYARARRAVRLAAYRDDRAAEIIATSAAAAYRREIRAAQRDRSAA